MTKHPSFFVTSREQWRRWLSENGDTATGVLLHTLKKGAGEGYVSYQAAVEEALCFGWIDSRPGPLDPRYRSLLYTPRKKKSVWSAVNRARVEMLMASGKMTAPGIAAVERAKADGSWEALVRSDTLTLPPEFEAALQENPVAAKNFGGFPPSVRKQLLQWVWNAKTAVTRDNRIREIIEKAARNERANQWQPRTK